MVLRARALSHVGGAAGPPRDLTDVITKWGVNVQLRLKLLEVSVRIVPGACVRCASDASRGCVPVQNIRHFLVHDKRPPPRCAEIPSFEVANFLRRESGEHASGVLRVLRAVADGGA